MCLFLGSGILSWNPEENPFLFSANVVYVPYCSSDAWSGNNTKSKQATPIIVII